jgi:hypothetical protein
MPQRDRPPFLRRISQIEKASERTKFAIVCAWSALQQLLDYQRARRAWLASSLREHWRRGSPWVKLGRTAADGWKASHWLAHHLPCHFRDMAAERGLVPYTRDGRAEGSAHEWALHEAMAITFDLIMNCRPGRRVGQPLPQPGTKEFDRRNGNYGAEIARNARRLSGRFHRLVRESPGEAPPDELERRRFLAELEMERCAAINRLEALAGSSLTPQARGRRHRARRPGATSRAGGQCSHGDDFRDVTWRGVRHAFTGNQAAVVGVLWKHWVSGNPDVSQERLQEGADTEQRIRDVFKRGRRMHPAWRTMIVPGATRGTLRLAGPSPLTN